MVFARELLCEHGELHLPKRRHYGLLQRLLAAHSERLLLLLLFR